ncbi:hypothetical protein [Streptomyces tauricus]|uniref:hypothetical protein n=1 Tax=Streptomyces tauricus TaxID=68274 RepID=UPI00343A9CC0
MDALGPLDMGGSEGGGVHDVLGRSQARVAKSSWIFSVNCLSRTEAMVMAT